jgi:hypothetical protein
MYDFYYRYILDDPPQTEAGVHQPYRDMVDGAFLRVALYFENLIFLGDSNPGLARAILSLKSSIFVVRSNVLRNNGCAYLRYEHIHDHNVGTVGLW